MAKEHSFEKYYDGRIWELVQGVDIVGCPVRIKDIIEHDARLKGYNFHGRVMDGENLIIQVSRKIA